MTVSITVLAAQGLGALISSAVPLLADKVTVVQEPPTASSGYPVASVMPEPAFRFDPEHETEVRDADGVSIMADDGRAMMSAGRVRTAVRIWIATRTPAQRELLKTQIVRLFFADEFAPTRLEIALAGFEVDGFAPPASWPVYFFLDDGEWQEEQVFSERRWVYLRCSVDIPILLMREDAWRVSQMVAALTAGPQVTPPTADPADEVLVDADGVITPAP